MENTNNTVKIKTAKTYDFKDVQGVHIPNKIKCSKCGREVQGNPELIYLRIMKDYDGQWLKYQKEWVCSNCKHEATRSLKEHLQAEKKVEAVKKAIQLLEENGYKVTAPLSGEVKAVAKKAKALTGGEVVKVA
jgi:DNA-directed RNA polymerase subunit RPC12/RpoP